MKYYRQEHEPLLEVARFREQQYQQYLVAEKALMEKKESVFKKDISQWQYTGSMMELVGRKHDLKQNKSLAFPFIMSKETQKLHEQKERVNYFTNQCMHELQRIGQDNGDALIEHFMSKATVQVEYINQQRDMWSEFLDFFGSGDPNMFDTDDEFEDELNNTMIRNSTAMRSGQVNDDEGDEPVDTSNIFGNMDAPAQRVSYRPTQTNFNGFEDDDNTSVAPI